MSKKESLSSESAAYLSPRKSLQFPIIASPMDRQELNKKIECQAKTIKKRKKAFELYKFRNDKIRSIYKSLKDDLLKLYPEKIAKMTEIEERVLTETSNEDFDPEFIPVEKAYCDEIEAFKDESKTLKSRIKLLLNILIEDEEEFSFSESDGNSDFEERISVVQTTPFEKDIFSSYERKAQIKINPFEP